MKNILLISFLLLLSSCFTGYIYRDFDEFENLRKFKLSKIYYAKKDFSGKKEVKINYYKSINPQGKVSVSARLYVYTDADAGKLAKNIAFRTGTDIYELNFDNIQSNYDAYHYDEDIGNDEHIEITHSTGENIRHFADFDIPNNLLESIMNTEQLSFRFYIGKEAYTYRFSKSNLKQLKKFLAIQ